MTSEAAELLGVIDSDVQSLCSELEDILREGMAIDIPFNLDADLKPIADKGMVQLALTVQIARDLRELARQLDKPVDTIDDSSATPVKIVPDVRAGA